MAWPGRFILTCCLALAVASGCFSGRGGGGGGELPGAGTSGLPTAGTGESPFEPPDTPLGGSSATTSSGPPIPSGPPSEAENALQDFLQQQFPEGFRPDGAPGSDTSVDIAADPDGDELLRMQQNPGETLTIAAGFSSSSGTTVDALCVGFGSPDNAWCVPMSSMQVNSTGTAAGFDLPIPSSLCSMLSSICHDIRCYEFARTGSGTFTRANINMLAAKCGNCSEPSCQSLLGPECEDGTASGCITDGDCVSGTMCVAGQCQTGMDICPDDPAPTCSSSEYCCVVPDSSGQCAVGPHCDSETCDTYGEVPCF